MYPPVLKTSRFTLQAYRFDDEDRFIEIALDKASIQFMEGANGDVEQERMLFNKCFELYKRNNKRWFWLWGIYQDDVLCGHLEMKESEHTASNELEIVYMIHPDERRTGLMTAVLSFLKLHQKDWQRRIIATVHPQNSSSISLLEKWGVEKTEHLMNDETGEIYFKFTLTE